MQINESHKLKQCYRAVKERDTSFTGSFFFGVKSTGIFCVPGCRARTPKAENIVYYTRVHELLDEGFRPCKLCKPTESAFELPDDIHQALHLVQESPYQKVKDTDLIRHGLRPEKLRRWFNKHYGMTFQAYQRQLRINSAYQELKEGKRVSATAFDSGYESLSGFAYTFKSVTGKEPQQSKNLSIVRLQRMQTPLGGIFIGATDKGICLLQFADDEKFEDCVQRLQEQYHARILFGQHPHITHAQRELAAYFEGRKDSFSTPLDLHVEEEALPFYQTIQELVFGQSYSLEDISNDLSIPLASAKEFLEANPVLILLPTHRILSASEETSYRLQSLRDIEGS